MSYVCVGRVVSRVGRVIRAKVKETRERGDLDVVMYSRVSSIPDPVVRKRVESRLSKVKEGVVKASH